MQGQVVGCGVALEALPCPGTETLDRTFSVVEKKNVHFVKRGSEGKIFDWCMSIIMPSGIIAVHDRPACLSGGRAYLPSLSIFDKGRRHFVSISAN
jgi:hypothetical protein